MIRLFLRFIRFLFTTIWGFFRFLAKGSSLILIVSLLAFNVATMTVTALGTFVSTLIYTVSGVDTALTRTKAELTQSYARRAEIEADLNLERGKTKYLAKQTGTLRVENSKLRVNGPDVNFHGKTRTMRSVVEETTSIVKKRTAKVAAANIGSMAGESIPFWGIAVVVGATTYEVASACDTMKDMQNLTTALSPGDTMLDDTDVSHVCGMAVPTLQELRSMVRSSPGAAWGSAKSFVSDLPTPDFGGIRDWFTSSLSWE
ncbi:MAG: hypothetical protein WBO29_06045 [Albidovulum sp.]